MTKRASRRIAACALAAIAACLYVAGSLRAAEKRFPPIPFEQWMAQGERKEIPWQVRVSSPRLSLQQRLLLELHVEIPAKPLTAGGTHELYMVARMADRDGRWLPGEGLRFVRLEEPIPKGGYFATTIEYFVLPGEYKIGVILWDPATGRRSVTQRPVRVRPIRSDPLPESFRNLPRVEVLSPTEGLDRHCRPDLRTKLWLPLETRRPLRVEVLVNFSASEQYAGTPRAHWIHVARMLNLLHVLAQVELRNGALRITGFDVARRRVLFDQENVRRVEWARLLEALQSTEPTVIGAGALEGRRRNAAFLRDFLAARLAAEARAESAAARGDASPAAPGAEPLRVFIVLGSPMLFARGADLKPLAFEGDCNCRVFYLQFRIGPSNLWDELRKILVPLHPREFTVDSAISLRRALSELLADLRRQ